MTTYITGDIHGSASLLKQRIRSCPYALYPEDEIIIAGDVGLEYGKYIFTDNELKETMSKYPCNFIIVRGNHDNRYWRDHTYFIHPEQEHFMKQYKMGTAANEGWHFEEVNCNIMLVEDKYPNIYYTEDCGGIYCFDNHYVLVCPGAYSIDKSYRIKHQWPYESEEQLTYTEWLDLANLAYKERYNIEAIIAHTFPFHVQDKLEYLFIKDIDQESVDKSSEKWLSIVESSLKPNIYKHFFGGHFHDDKELDEKYTLLYNNIVKLEDYL